MSGYKSGHERKDAFKLVIRLLFPFEVPLESGCPVNFPFNRPHSIPQTVLLWS
jgi:hypothetical protein